MMEDEQELELALPNRVRALETNVLHASDVLYWLDATSAATMEEMDRVPHAMQIRFTEKPSDVRVLNSVGRTALWRIPTEPMVQGYATEAQRTRQAEANYIVAGEVRDSSGRFNPRTFSANVGAGSGVGIELFPTLARTKIPAAGAIHGHIQFVSDDSPAAWALLELEVTVAVNESLTFRAQADKAGDFVLTLNQLPPLPESITEYVAVLRVDGNTNLDADTIPNHANFVAMEMESTTAADDFQSDLTLTIRPGENARINSINKNHIAIQPA